MRALQSMWLGWTRRQKIFTGAALLVIVAGGPYWAAQNHRYQMQRRVVEAWIARQVVNERAFYETLGEKLFVDTDESDPHARAEAQPGDPSAEQLQALTDGDREEMFATLKAWERMPDDVRRALLKNYRAYWRLESAARARLRAQP